MVSARKLQSIPVPSLKSPARASTSQPQHWALNDLKRIEETRAARRAESLLGKIRRIARSFSATKSEEPNFSFDDELHIRASLFSLNPGTKILRVDSHMLICRAPRMENLPRLFAPYGLKGGAARLALQSLLGRDVRALRPRDIDVVRFGGTSSPELHAMDRRIESEFMSEDAQHGHGVEVVPSIDLYLRTRDFTINEVTLMGGQLICSRRAIEDTFHGVIRPSDHLGTQGSMLDGKMFMKALRLCAEAIAHGEPASLEALPPYCLATPFEVALHLSRAEQRSREAALYYIQLAFEYGALDPNDFPARGLEEVKAQLQEMLGSNYPDAFSATESSKSAHGRARLVL